MIPYLAMLVFLTLYSSERAFYFSVKILKIIKCIIAKRIDIINKMSSELANMFVEFMDFAVSHNM